MPDIIINLTLCLNFSTWLWNIARGINGDEVQGRLLPKSHGSGKTFPGPRALKTFASVSNYFPTRFRCLKQHYRSLVSLVQKHIG